MQRLHERDLSALCQDLGFEHVCLPAEAETWTNIVFPRSERFVTRNAGDLLWPAREGRSELEALKQMLSSVAQAGQYQQRPVPAGAAIFRGEGFQYYDEPPALTDVAQS